MYKMLCQFILFYFRKFSISNEPKISLKYHSDGMEFLKKKCKYLGKLLKQKVCSFIFVTLYPSTIVGIHTQRSCSLVVDSISSSYSKGCGFDCLMTNYTILIIKNDVYLSL